MGAEAGQDVGLILQRKELERRACDGTFIWGVGNGVGAAIHGLVSSDATPPVLFSPIRGPAAALDTNPSGVLLWLDYLGADNVTRPLPTASVVTSRCDTPRGTRKRLHFALFCASDVPLEAADHGRIRFGELRNLASNRPVGFSQVTAVVSRGTCAENASSLEYEVALFAHLKDPYCVRLANAVEIDGNDLDIIERASASNDPYFWTETVANLKRERASRGSMRDAVTQCSESL
jgi:hypothetical protein